MIKTVVGELWMGTPGTGDSRPGDFREVDEAGKPIGGYVLDRIPELAAVPGFRLLGADAGCYAVPVWCEVSLDALHPGRCCAALAFCFPFARGALFQALGSKSLFRKPLSPVLGGEGL